MLYDDYKCPYCGKELDLSWDELEYVSIDDCIDERMFQYECPHCGKMVKIDADDVDFDEEALCPECGKELFPELPDGAEEEPDAKDGE